MSTTRRPRVVERMVAAKVVLYSVSELNARGEIEDVAKIGQRGDVIQLNSRELLRLELLGVIAPESFREVKQLDEAEERVYQSYLAARQSLAGEVAAY